jgi:hypothetical protein
VVGTPVGEGQGDAVVRADDAGGRFQEIALVLDGEPLLGGDLPVGEGLLDVLLVVERRGDDLPWPADRRGEVDVLAGVIGLLAGVLACVVPARRVRSRRAGRANRCPVGR